MFVKKEESAWLSYDEAKHLISKYNLRSVGEFISFSKSRKIEGVPSCPDRHYTNKGTWKNWKDFLGIAEYDPDEEPDEG